MAYNNTSFTMATPFTSRPRSELLRLVTWLAVNNPDFAPLLRIAALHFAAIGYIDSVRDAKGERRKLDSRYLLFFSLFDGSGAAYLADFSVLVPDYIDSIWGHCKRYPGARGFERFNHWLGRHSLPDEPKPGRATFYEYHGYRVDPESVEPVPTDGERPPDRRLAPKPLIERALELRRRLDEIRRQIATKGEPTAKQLRELAVEML